MRKTILYSILFLTVSCSNKIQKEVIGPPPLLLLEEEEEEEEEEILNKRTKILSGKVYYSPSQKGYDPVVLLLHYNDSIVTYANSDFDNNFTFYNFRRKLITEKSYIFAANRGCISKKMVFKDLKKPIKITFVRDSIHGLSDEEYGNLIIKYAP